MSDDPRFMPAPEEEKKKDDDSAFIGRRLFRARTILVSEAVTPKLARNVAAQLIALQDADAESPITLYVNSPGGSADCGFAIYDMLRFVRPPIRSVCNGLCASAAVLIYLSAERKRRYSLPNSRFLLHQPSTQMMGSASDIEINALEIINLRKRYNEIVAAETGKSLDQITKDADRDFWLSPPQAAEYGLVGKIVKSHTEM